MAFGPLLKQLAAQAARNPQVQKAMRSAAANVVNNPQVRQGMNTVRTAFRRGVDTVTGRNTPPSGAKPKTSSSSSSSGSGAGSGKTKSPFADMHAFWTKNKAAIGSFVAANFMGIIIFMQLGNGLWPLLKQAMFGHPHEQQQKKKLKEKQAADAAAAAAASANADGNQTANDLGQTQFSDKEDGMTFYNVTDTQTVNTAANPMQSRSVQQQQQQQQQQQRPKKQRKEQQPTDSQQEHAVDTEVAYATHAPPAPPVEQPPQLSASTEEIFAHSKANSGAVATFANSFHYKVGDGEAYQSSVESEGVAGRDAREAKGAKKGSAWASFFRRGDDPLGRARGLSSDSGEQTLVFDMRYDEKEH